MNTPTKVVLATIAVAALLSLLIIVQNAVI